MAWLDDPEMIEERCQALAQPHLLPLEAWRQTLLVDGQPVPHFDPADGGINARLLLLLETPGPGPDRTRFVSRDNTSGTARKLRRYLDEAGIDRRDMLLWNTVPWIMHVPGVRNRALRKCEIERGLATLPGLLTQLPKLKVCLLAGRVAAKAEHLVSTSDPSITIITMPHPSPANVCTSPKVGERVRAAFDEAAAALCNQS